MPKREINSVHGPGGILRRLSEDRFNDELRGVAQETADLIESKIIAAAPPSFASGIEAQMVEDGKGRFKIVATAEVLRQSGWDESGPTVDIAPFVDQGTGMFGPRKQEIIPAHGRSMIFYWDKPGRKRDYGGFQQGWWNVKKIQGQKAQHFMRRGWRNASAIIRRRYRELLSRL